MIFLNFSQLPESVFHPNFSGKHFSGNQTKFFLLESIFHLSTFLMANKYIKVSKHGINCYMLNSRIDGTTPVPFN